MSLSQSNPDAAQFDPGELDAEIRADGTDHLTMLDALERAGLIMRC